MDRRQLRSLAAPSAILWLLIMLSGAEATAISDATTPSKTSAMHDLMARAARPTEYVCHWKDVINTTNTTPLVLVIGLSIGGIAGMGIAGFTFYKAGQTSRMGGMM